MTLISWGATVQTCGQAIQLAMNNGIKVDLIDFRSLLPFDITSLHGAILRVAGYDTPFPHALESSYMPSPEKVLRAVRKVVRQ